MHLALCPREAKPVPGPVASLGDKSEGEDSTVRVVVATLELAKGGCFFWKWGVPDPLLICAPASGKADRGLRLSSRPAGMWPAARGAAGPRRRQSVRAQPRGGGWGMGGENSAPRGRGEGLPGSARPGLPARGPAGAFPALLRAARPRGRG